MGNTSETIMAEEQDETFETAESGASLTTPSEAGAVKKGGFLLVKGFPCKVVDIKTSKTGKHGHAKCVFTALDIFTNKKLEMMSPSTHGVQVPVVKRKTWQCIDIDDEGYASLMDDDSNTREDLKFLKPSDDPNGLDLQTTAQELIDEDGACLIDVQSAMDIDQIMSVKKELVD